MKSTDIVKAIGEVDEKYTISAEKSFNSANARETGRKILHGLKIAACVAAVIVVTVVLRLPSVLFPHDLDPTAASGTTGKDAAMQTAYELTEYTYNGGLSYTKDDVGIFCAALSKSGLLNGTVNEKGCYQITPDGFYEAVGAKLFSVDRGAEGIYCYMYKDDLIARLCGGVSVRLSSFAACDPDENGVMDFIYAYSLGSGMISTVIKYYNMDSHESVWLGVVDYYFAYIAQTPDANRFEICRKYDVPTDLTEKFGYIEIKDGGFDVRITGMGRNQTIE